MKIYVKLPQPVLLLLLLILLVQPQHGLRQSIKLLLRFLAPIRHYSPERWHLLVPPKAENTNQPLAWLPWGISSSEDLSEPPSLRDPVDTGLWLDGSIIIDCSGHGRRRATSRQKIHFSRSHLWCHLLTASLTCCRWSWRMFLYACPFQAEQLTYLCFWMWPS